MVNSMTGFGEGKAEGDRFTVSVQIQTTNHKYLDVRVHGLRDHRSLQQKVEKQLKDFFSRGRINAEVDLQSGESLSLEDVGVSTLQKSYDRLVTISRKLGLKEDPSLDHLIALGAFDAEGISDDVWPQIETALETAVRKVRESRSSEGRKLKKELEGYLESIEDLVDQAEEEISRVVKDRKERLRERTAQLIRNGEVEEKRLEQEIALLADKVDISEEAVRVRSHVEEALQVLKEGGAVGKKLDFIAQELKRETNTIGAKSKDSQLQSLAIEMKLETEKIKEQVRNIE